MGEVGGVLTVVAVGVGVHVAVAVGGGKGTVGSVLVGCGVAVEV